MLEECRDFSNVHELLFNPDSGTPSVANWNFRWYVPTSFAVVIFTKITFRAEKIKSQINLFGFHNSVSHWIITSRIVLDGRQLVFNVPKDLKMTFSCNRLDIFSLYPWIFSCILYCVWGFRLNLFCTIDNTILWLAKLKRRAPTSIKLI